VTLPITPLAADIIGIIGSVCFISGFAYANMTKAMNHLWFNVLNLVGAVLLLISLSVHFNLAAFVLEIVWGAIAILGIGKALWERRYLPSRLREGSGEGLSQPAPRLTDTPHPNPSPKGEGLS
jgi:hypothetical protein